MFSELPRLSDYRLHGIGALFVKRNTVNDSQLGNNNNSGQSLTPTPEQSSAPNDIQPTLHVQNVPTVTVLTLPEHSVANAQKNHTQNAGHQVSAASDKFMVNLFRVSLITYEWFGPTI